jgi:hypothetical protein
MSAYSNRALYVNPATNHGRGLYNPLTGRVIYADASLVAASACSIFGDYHGAYSLNPIAESDYQHVQDEALAVLKADSTLTTTTGRFAYVQTIRQKRYQRVLCYHYAARFTFALPTGLRGSINKFRLRSNIGAGEFWDTTGHIDNTYYNSAAYNDFGCVLKLFFSESSTAYADGDDLYSGTADVEVPFADINDLHEDLGNAIVVGVNTADLFSKVVISADDAAEKINDFTSDTIYVWAAITRPNYLPYLFADDGGVLDATEEFSCTAMLNNLSILVSAD